MKQIIRRARAEAKRSRPRPLEEMHRMACPACHREYANRQSLRGHVRYEHGRSLKQLEREFLVLQERGLTPSVNRISPGMLLGDRPLDWNAMFASFQAKITQGIGTMIRQELRMFVQHVAGQAFQDIPSVSPVPSTKKRRRVYAEEGGASLRKDALHAVGFNGKCLKCGQPTPAPKITRKDGQLLTGQRPNIYWKDAIKHSRRYTALCWTCVMKRTKAAAA